MSKQRKGHFKSSIRRDGRRHRKWQTEFQINCEDKLIMKKSDKFSEISINGKIAKNRFIRSATNTHLDNVDGTISDAEIEM